MPIFSVALQRRVVDYVETVIDIEAANEDAARAEALDPEIWGNAYWEFASCIESDMPEVKNVTLNT
jgi:hypothetical protein